MTTQSVGTRAVVVGLLLLTVACQHSDSFSNGVGADLPPRSTTPPIQLTYDLGYDLTPAWLVDGSEVAYTWTSIADSGNRCLAVIPAEGGSRHSQKCWPRIRLADSVSSINWAAPTLSGRAAWVDQIGKRSRRPPDRSALRVGILQSGDTGALVKTFPYLAASGALHQTAIHLTWLSHDSLAYIGSEVIWGRFDTTTVGIEIVIADLTQTPATFSIVPNTVGATSLWAAQDGKAIYYTLAGDTRVLQMDLATGVVSTLYDFIARGVPSSISMGGNFLAAIVGDTLERVNLTSGAVDPIHVPGASFIMGRISPSGDRVVVQQFDPIGMNLWIYHFP